MSDSHNEWEVPQSQEKLESQSRWTEGMLSFGVALIFGGMFVLTYLSLSPLIKLGIFAALFLVLGGFFAVGKQRIKRAEGQDSEGLLGYAKILAVIATLLLLAYFAFTS